MNIHAKSCFGLILLIISWNRNRFSVFSCLLTLSLHLFLLEPRFHTKSNNAQFPPLRHLMCVPRQSCECAALSGWASSRFLAIYNVNRQPSIGVSPWSRRWGGGESFECDLGLRDSLRFVWSVFPGSFLCFSSMFVGILPLSQLSPDFLHIPLEIK